MARNLRLKLLTKNIATLIVNAKAKESRRRGDGLPLSVARRARGQNCELANSVEQRLNLRTIRKNSALSNAGRYFGHVAVE